MNRKGLQKTVYRSKGKAVDHVIDCQSQGGGRMWKRDQHSFFFFRGLLDTPPPSTFLIEYVFPRLMSFFLKKIQKIYM